MAFSDCGGASGPTFLAGTQLADSEPIEGPGILYRAEGDLMSDSPNANPRPLTCAPAGSGDATALEGGPRVLVVDDEPSIVDAVATSLRYEGFVVSTAATGREALAVAQDERPDLIVLDVMLPDLSGMDVAGRLRRDGFKTPVLFLTARHGVEDRVAGLAVGDDYMTKPFSLAEVVARTRAILRRTKGDEGGRLRFADLELDEDTHEVHRAGVPIQLTATEFALLRFFLLNRRRVVSKAQILDHVWNYDFGGDASVVETYVSYLRKKLDALGPPLIHTIRLVGYSLREPPDSAPFGA
jgi:two-component system, OmpR family, response regulator